MKISCFLLAVILLVLSCIPCNDAGAMPAGPSQLTTTQDAMPEPAGTKHDDDCSPFCQCSCCSVIYALPELMDAVPVTVTEAATILFASYMQQSPVGMVLPVWQPPRLI